MIDLGSIAEGFRPILGGPLTPEGRFNAARNMPTSPTFWLWVLLFVIIGIAVVGIAVILIFRRLSHRRHIWAAFHSQADHLGLSTEERNLLAHLAGLAEVRDPVAIFTMDDAFNQASLTFLQSGRVTALDERARTYACALLSSLREKLGFHGAAAETETISSTRHIPEGTRVSIMHRGAPDSFQATIWQSDSMELVVEPETAVQCHPGEGWLVRFADGGSVWEFDAPVIRTTDGRIVLGHSDHVRFINRRRFPRIAVNKSALLAPFPFLKPDATDEPPRFFPATLVEIAGPGLKLETQVELRPGEKTLVVLKLQESKVVEALGKVRRMLPGRAGAPVAIVELVGLNSAEVSELARETSAAERDAAAQEPQDAEEPDLAASSV